MPTSKRNAKIVPANTEITSHRPTSVHFGYQVIQPVCTYIKLPLSEWSSCTFGHWMCMQILRNLKLVSYNNVVTDRCCLSEGLHTVCAECCRPAIHWSYTIGFQWAHPVYVHNNDNLYSVCSEDHSKNNPGGLKGRKYKPKVVPHYSNVKNPTRCFVRIFNLIARATPFI